MQEGPVCLSVVASGCRADVGGHGRVGRRAWSPGPRPWQLGRESEGASASGLS